MKFNLGLFIIIAIFQFCTSKSNTKEKPNIEPKRVIIQQEKFYTVNDSGFLIDKLQNHKYKIHIANTQYFDSLLNLYTNIQIDTFQVFDFTIFKFTSCENRCYVPFLVALEKLNGHLFQNEYEPSFGEILIVGRSFLVSTYSNIDGLVENNMKIYKVDNTGILKILEVENLKNPTLIKFMNFSKKNYIDTVKFKNQCTIGDFDYSETADQLKVLEQSIID
ncbi:MAG: hypothetical protein IT244_03090 [Bacteroidia bacterium]|nr:hypothetical protein [Bacteroidia bacterium]